MNKDIILGKEESCTGVIQISEKWLLALYIVFPLSALFVLWDYYFMGGVIKSIGPKNPENWSLFMIFFNTPHILASSLSYMDRDYIRFYQSKLLLGIPVVALITLFLPKIIGALWMGVFIALTTIYHVIAQQVGLNKMMLRRVDRNYIIWKWLTIALSAVIYLLLFFRYRLPIFNNMKILIGIWVLFYIISTYYFVKLVRFSGKRMGFYYSLANHGMVFFVFIFFLLDMPFFAILGPRVVHDITAFMFYVTHDTNRFKAGGKNWIFNTLKCIQIPIFIMGPIVAILLAQFLNLYEDINYSIWFNIVIFFTFIHYYTESFSWQNGSLHRKYISIKM